MEFFALLVLGVLIGMQHALEADHLAAIAALSGKRDSLRALVLRGSAWGLGHTFTLLTICALLLLLGERVSPRTEALLELAVGAMIVVLGLNVLRTVWRRRPHFHVHEHEYGNRHVHVHSHEDDLSPHSASAHDHEHHHSGLRRALLVGMVHGAAGSAGLLVLAASAGSVTEALGFVAAFGTGSIAGMATLSLAVSFPLRWIERSATWVNTAAFASIGCAAIIIGCHLLGQNWNSLV